MSTLVEHYIKSLNEILEGSDIESDPFNNALDIIQVIDDLHINGYISDFDLSVINAIASGYNFSEISEIEGKNRKTVSDSFSDTCGKIAYRLGDRFTDEWFIHNIALKYVKNSQDRESIETFFRR